MSPFGITLISSSARPLEDSETNQTKERPQVHKNLCLSLVSIA